MIFNIFTRSSRRLKNQKEQIKKKNLFRLIIFENSFSNYILRIGFVRCFRKKNLLDNFQSDSLFLFDMIVEMYALSETLLNIQKNVEKIRRK